MEYRQKSRSRRGRAAANRASDGTAKAVIALIMVAAIVYLISASAIGSWIAEVILAPLFTFFDRAELPENTPTPADISMSPIDQATAVQGITDELTFPAFACYALQMGVYGDYNNANTQAEELRARGAGGYVLEDAGRYRVLAAAYTTQEALAAVRAQLQAESMDSAVYTFSAEQSTLRITATQAQLDAISSAFRALAHLQTDMAAATLAFDQLQQAPAAGREKAAQLIASLNADSAQFLALGEVDHPVLNATRACLHTCNSRLGELADYQVADSVDFSSKMKYTHISIVQAYDTLAQTILQTA